MVGDHRSIDSDLDPRQRGIGRVNKHEGCSVRCERRDPAGPNHRPVTPHDGIVFLDGRTLVPVDRQ